MVNLALSWLKYKNSKRCQICRWKISWHSIFFLPNLYKIIKLFKYFSLSYRWVFLCSSEDCVNPKMYENWDFCELVTQEDCMSEDQLILKEYCPATCDCSKYKQYPFRWTFHKPSAYKDYTYESYIKIVLIIDSHCIYGAIVCYGFDIIVFFSAPYEYKKQKPFEVKAYTYAELPLSISFSIAL